MSKIQKALISFLLLAILLLVYILLNAQKVDTKSTQNIRDLQEKGKVETERQEVPISSELQEERYRKSIDKIVKDYQSFIDYVNQKIDSKIANTDAVYTIFNASDTLTIEQIDKDLKSTLVPERFKDFHLLLSRSLLKLSSYLNASNPEDMLAGLELLEQAREEFDKLDIG